MDVVHTQTDPSVIASYPQVPAGAATIAGRGMQKRMNSAHTRARVPLGPKKPPETHGLPQKMHASALDRIAATTMAPSKHINYVKINSFQTLQTNIGNQIRIPKLACIPNKKINMQYECHKLIHL